MQTRNILRFAQDPRLTLHVTYHLISDTAEDHCICLIGLHKAPVKPLWKEK